MAKKIKIKKIKSKSFIANIELKNVLRTLDKNSKGEYGYVFDVYIEGKLETKSARSQAHTISEIINNIKKNGLKTKIFLGGR
jgi:Cdc6-like AAA superfamily ATPase